MLQKLHSQLDTLARTPLGQPRRKDGLAKRIAVQEAVIQLGSHGLRVVASRGGKLCQLAAVLFGQPRSNLYHQCVEVLAERTDRSRND